MSTYIGTDESAASGLVCGLLCGDLAKVLFGKLNHLIVVNT